MSESVILLEKNEGVATLTLNRPHAMNALSRRLRASIYEAFEELKNDAEVRVVIITGAGRAFCAGLDLKEVAAEGLAVGDDFDGPGSAVGMFWKIFEFDRPIIGAVNGPAVTGGFELALMCDILFASNQARFADTHARVGLMPGAGLSQNLPRIIGPGRAKELSFTGNYLSAHQAERWGLVNRVLPPDELMPACRALAGDIMSCVPTVVTRYKHLIDQGFRTTLSEGFRFEKEAFLEDARQVPAASVAERLQVVMERGRNQQN